MNQTMPPSVFSAQMLKIHEVEAFRAVMLRGTVTEAAVMLHTSQPVVSKLLARFQRIINIRLFELRKSRLVPTQEAYILFKTIQRTYIGLDHVAQTISELQGGHRGRLSIGCLPSFGMGPLTSITADFLKLEPEVQISIETVNSSLIRHSVLSGKIDMGIIVPSIDMSGMEVEPLVSDHLVCVMDKSNPLSSRRKIHIDDLRNQPMVFPSRESATRAMMDQIFLEQDFAPTISAETSYGMTMCLLALQGAGAALVSPHVAMPLKRAGLIVKKFEPQVQIELVLLTALDHPRSRLANTFIDFMKQALVPD
ncbi:hypothetical protein W822_18530 [Advenella kashmirensis W13003]|uniref:HTH lysR-type domain-containing protein n=1 Tax=Advenella kashmirensis W13003 TaxID=1424334 RepID=V8QN60_9BURK|nr:LysR substrate-binding domain-containing protein [Advenella kashmirensis]ETF01416.1 hypothetical protein W822_18530 [Advenella kashmirensis W13003]